MQFSAPGAFGDPDFSIGTVEMNSTPEPTSMVLLGTGLLGVGLRFRRKK